MINAEQIRSARALLDWSTTELANRTGMTVNAINRIERGHVNAQRGTTEKLEKVFEEAGVEFLPGCGLRRKNSSVKIYEGKDFRRKIFIDVYKTLKKTGGEFLLAHEDEDMATKDMGLTYAYNQLEKRRKVGITHRFLVRADDKKLVPPLHTYHVTPDKFFSLYSLYIYGTKIALSSREYLPRSIIIDNTFFAESLKKLFNYIWDNTTDIPTYWAQQSRLNNASINKKGKKK